MPNKVLIQTGDGTPKQIVLANHAGDFSPTAANDLRDATAGNRTNAELVLASVLDGAYAQSAKFDLGEHYAPFYEAKAALEFAATPADGDMTHLYFDWSLSGTATRGNSAGLSGSAAAYTGYSSNPESALRSGVLPPLSKPSTVQATATIQVVTFGLIRPTNRYGIVVFRNESNADMHSDDVEMHIVLNPRFLEVQ